jgi:hypothetical protein
MAKVVVSGCSFTEGAAWPEVLFPNDHIINLGRAGAGNTYIAESVLHAVYHEPDVQSVFMVFSGINRTDIMVPNTPGMQQFLEQHKYGATLGSRCYVFSGGDKFSSLILRNYPRIKDPAWPDVQTIDQYLELPANIRKECIEMEIVEWRHRDYYDILYHACMLNHLDNPDFLSDRTYLNLIAVFDALERRNIPYHFTFCGDVFDRDFQTFLGNLDPRSPYYGMIDWRRYISCTPWEHGIETNQLNVDGIHPSLDGQRSWATKLKSGGWLC